MYTSSHPHSLRAVRPGIARKRLTDKEIPPAMPPPPPQKLRKQATAASGGGAGIGLLALIVGLVLHGHYAPIKHVCESGVGVLGQALEPSAQQKCSLDSALAEIGTVATVLGALILAGVLITAIGLLIEAHAENSQPVAPKRPPTTGLAPTRTESSTAQQRED